MVGKEQLSGGTRSGHGGSLHSTFLQLGSGTTTHSQDQPGGASVEFPVVAIIADNDERVPIEVARERVLQESNPGTEHDFRFVV